MPIYYFDTHDGNSFLKDEVGLYFINDQVAFEEASKATASLALMSPIFGHGRNFTMWVRSAAGDPLMQLTISYAAKLPN